MTQPARPSSGADSQDPYTSSAAATATTTGAMTGAAERVGSRPGKLTDAGDSAGVGDPSSMRTRLLVTAAIALLLLVSAALTTFFLVTDEEEQSAGSPPGASGAASEAGASGVTAFPRPDVGDGRDSGDAGSAAPVGAPRCAQVPCSDDRTAGTTSISSTDTGATGRGTDPEEPADPAEPKLAAAAAERTHAQDPDEGRSINCEPDHLTRRSMDHLAAGVAYLPDRDPVIGDSVRLHLRVAADGTGGATAVMPLPASRPDVGWCTG